MSGKEHDPKMTMQEWSHYIESDEISGKALCVEIYPPEEVVPALCKRLGLCSIKTLRADLNLLRNSVSKVVHVQGKIQADVCQKCVVTTESVQEIIEDEFEAWFADPSQAVSFTKARRERMSRKEKNEQPILEESDDPETIVDGKIDLGELVVQQLSLALNPYPRLEGALYNEGEKSLEEAPEGTYDNPFAALKDWKASEAKKEK